MTKLTSWTTGASVILAAIGLTQTVAIGQGCVAVRGGGQCVMGHAMGMEGEGGYLQGGDWQVSVTYRWLDSDKHYSGDRYNATRIANDTEVINKSHFIDMSALYAINSRFSVGLTLPFVTSTRSSKYEHGDGFRHTSSATGIGDVRLTGYAWLIDPKSNPKGNISFGLGIKLPTGDDAATDTFYTKAGPVKGYVDQSIQPGDGGYGFTAEFYAFREIYGRLSGYAQAYYLFNPQNQNGVSTDTGIKRQIFERVMSVPDQYLGRLGLSLVLWPEYNLTLSGGVRLEGIPVEDVFGGSTGFRRPGFIFSYEPGISISHKGWSLNISAPVAFYRNREQSISDKQLEAFDGKPHHGDAAFADYVLTASISKRF